MDEDGNLQFNNQYLEEIDNKNTMVTQDTNLKEVLEKNNRNTE